MKDSYARGLRAAALAGAACVLASSTEPASAQSGSAGAKAVERRIETMNRQGDQYERDKADRDRQGSAHAAGDRRRARDLTEQVKHDFEGLQAGYNRIVLAMSSGQRLDSDSISGAVAEVKKCAARLRENLALPREKEEGGAKAPGAAGAAPLEESLRTLSKHIYSFVTNPIFEAPGVLDVEQAKKAGHDLEMILKLSDGVSRGAVVKGRQD